MTAFPLVFCYSGSSLPKYAAASIRLAHRFNNLPITLICETLPRGIPHSIEHIDPRDLWERPQNFGRGIKSDPSFRDQFWIRTWERFAILNEYAKMSGPRTFLHAELDQVFFNLEEFSDFLLSLPTPLACPRHSGERMVASCFFIKDSTALESLVAFGESGRNFSNEMEILSQFNRHSPCILGELPTLESLFSADLRAGDTSKQALEVPVLFDAARLGQLFLGEDPRNSTSWLIKGGAQCTEPFSLTDPKLNQEWTTLLQNLKVRIAEGRAWLDLSDGNSFPLANLHIHSKVHRYLEKRNHLRHVVYMGSGTNRNYGLNPNPVAVTLRRARKGFDRSALGKRLIRLKRSLFSQINST